MKCLSGSHHNAKEKLSVCVPNNSSYRTKLFQVNFKQRLTEVGVTLMSQNPTHAQGLATAKIENKNIKIDK